MKLRDIFKDKVTKIFRVVNSDVDNELDMEIEPTNLGIIPDEEGYFIIQAIQVEKKKLINCFMDMNTPERVSDIVITKGLLGNVKVLGLYSEISNVIPNVASDSFGNYELYYSIENPQIGIDVLKNGLQIASNKNIVSEDLGYILRDENKIEEAIDAFSISEKFGPTTPYTYLELSHLFEKLGDSERKEKYFNKFKDHGGKIINIS